MEIYGSRRSSKRSQQPPHEQNLLYAQHGMCSYPWPGLEKEAESRGEHQGDQHDTTENTRKPKKPSDLNNEYTSHIFTFHHSCCISDDFVFVSERHYLANKCYHSGAIAYTFMIQYFEHPTGTFTQTRTHVHKRISSIMLRYPCTTIRGLILSPIFHE